MLLIKLNNPTGTDVTVARAILTFTGYVTYGPRQIDTTNDYLKSSEILDN